MSLKHIIFLFIAVLFSHLGGFIAMLLFSGAFYFIFAFFREQVCLIACPYGRLQGVLLDNKSIVVAYDYKRGEPRGKHNPLEDRDKAEKGDCIDCKNCITVCPTGIDIRNGTQLECINCTACMDACDSIMDRVKKPRGLIRYSSEKGIAEGHNSIFNARAIAYSAFLTLLLILLAGLFTLRTEVEATILRVPGTLFQEYGPENYSNVYKIQLVNKTRADLPVELKLETGEGEVIVMGGPILVSGGKVVESNFLLVKPKTSLSSSNTSIIIGVYSEGKQIEKFNTTFIGPNSLDK